EKSFRREPAMNGHPAQDYFLFIRPRHAPMPSMSKRKTQTGGRCPSGPEEDEPDDAKDQDREPSRCCQQRKHRRARLSLARLGRGFDDPAMLSCCHRSLIRKNAVFAAGAVARPSGEKRMVGSDVPAPLRLAAARHPGAAGSSCSEPDGRRSVNAIGRFHPPARSKGGPGMVSLTVVCCVSE